MKRKTFSCEFVNGSCRERDVLTASSSEAEGVKHQNLLPAAYVGTWESKPLIPLGLSPRASASSVN